MTELVLVPDPTPAERIALLENEIARLAKLLEEQANDWEREARNSNDDWYQEIATDLREEIKKRDPARSIMERVEKAEELIDAAERAKSQAEGEFWQYRRETEQVRAFARWIADRFDGLFQMDRIATGWRSRERAIEKALRELVTRIEKDGREEYSWLAKQGREALEKPDMEADLIA